MSQDPAFEWLYLSEEDELTDKDGVCEAGKGEKEQVSDKTRRGIRTELQISHILINMNINELKTTIIINLREINEWTIV